jgi:hypothetical protein
VCGHLEQRSLTFGKVEEQSLRNANRSEAESAKPSFDRVDDIGH